MFCATLGVSMCVCATTNCRHKALPASSWLRQKFPALLGNGKLAAVAEELKKIGYAHVT